ncbi:unnamed protein product [Cochlearia groenlandica]
MDSFRESFRPRILIDVSKIDVSTTVLGFNIYIYMPIMIAPAAMQKMAHHHDGELATARATPSAGTIMVYKDRNAVRHLVKRAEEAGFKAIALTTNDSGLASYVAGQVDQSVSWKDIKRLQSITNLPILVKGVITAEDAKIAVEYGAAGIIVSNHGARQLDYVPATIISLEEVVKAVAGRILVFLDGGVRRGTDVFKAVALGTSGVFVGRPSLFSLAADGEAGVRKMLQMLRDEFELTMALSGCRSLREITRNHIKTDWDMPPRYLPSKM